MFCKISEAVCFISVGRSFCMTLFYMFLLTTTKKLEVIMYDCGYKQLVKSLEQLSF